MFIKPSNLTEASVLLSRITEVTAAFKFSGTKSAPKDLPPYAQDAYLASVLTSLFRFEIAQYFGENNDKQIRELVINIEKEMRKNPEFKYDMLALADTIAGIPMTAIFDERLSCSKGLRIVSIQNTVSLTFNIKVADMKSPKRDSKTVMPRHIAMFLCRELTSRSFPEIAREFKRKDHTTIMHAVNRIIDMIKVDENFREDVHKLRCILSLPTPSFSQYRTANTA